MLQLDIAYHSDVLIRHLNSEIYTFICHKKSLNGLYLRRVFNLLDSFVSALPLVSIYEIFGLKRVIVNNKTARRANPTIYFTINCNYNYYYVHKNENGPKRTEERRMNTHSAR